MKDVTFSVMFTGNQPMRDYISLAQQVETYGFDQIHIADDLVFRPAWPILTLIALHTSRIQLGPFIVTPIAHPTYHAGHLAALDELSGGRMVCGVGRGGAYFLIGEDIPAKPIKFVREAWQVIKHTIRQERADYDGEYFHVVKDFYLQMDTPRDIPLYVGSWGPKMTKAAGAYAAGVKADCCASPEYVAMLRKNLDEGAREAGRDPKDVKLIIGPMLSIDDDRDAARDAVAGLLSWVAPLLAPMTTAAGLTDEEMEAPRAAFYAGDFERAKSLVSQRSIDAFCTTGTVSDVIERVEALIDAGADQVSFIPPHGPNPAKSLHILGEQILPHFKRRG